MVLEFAAAGTDVAINWLDDDAAAQRVADDPRRLDKGLAEDDAFHLRETIDAAQRRFLLLPAITV